MSELKKIEYVSENSGLPIFKEGCIGIEIVPRHISYIISQRQKELRRLNPNSFLLDLLGIDELKDMGNRSCLFYGEKFKWNYGSPYLNHIQDYIEDLDEEIVLTKYKIEEEVN